MTIKTPIGRLRIVAILEGISYLLFAITMPLKYVYGIKEPNMIVGMAHGWLFIAYVFLSFQNIFKYKLNWQTSFFVLIASLLPIATFIADHKIFKPQQLADHLKSTI
jgi:integral membrane protein